MKPSLIFSQYVWLVNTLRQYGRLTHDFLHALVSVGPDLEILEPAELRREMKELLKSSLDRN